MEICARAARMSGGLAPAGGLAAASLLSVRQDAPMGGTRGTGGQHVAG